MITFPLDLSDVKERVYACEWNGGDIVELHTLESLKAKYEDSLWLDPDAFDGADFYEYVEDYFKDCAINDAFNLENLAMMRVK
jgi:hypothetical protein